MKQTFYDWCIETENTYLLDLWDYELNAVYPKDIGKSSSKKIYFKCPNGIHESELYTINNITGDKHQKVKCRKCHSFGQWCLDNNQQELLDRWDYELNNKNPFEVEKYSSKCYYFKCPIGNPLHPSEPKSISNVVQQEGSRGCRGCNSFAQWCIDNVDSDFIEKYWSDKNTINPFTILPTYTKGKIWIKCQEKEHHGDYDTYAFNFVKGARCPYCSSKRINYYDSLGYMFKDKGDFWSCKNTISPFEVAPYSNKTFWFHCDVHGEYQAKACDFTYNNGMCLKCSRDNNISKLQMNVQTYIESLGYKCLHEGECNLVPKNPLTRYRLLYDNEIPELKLIVEVNGKQHYNVTLFATEQAKINNCTPEEELEYQQWKDNFKKDYAIQHGYNYLEIPYNTITRSEKYKKLIDDKIEEILSNNRSVTTTGGSE